MSLNTGDILLVYCNFVGRKKCVICICPKKCYFFLINSEPRRTSPEAQIEIKQKEYSSFLKRDSYINTAEIMKLPLDDVTNGKKLGFLKSATKNIILEVVKDSKYLPKKHIELTVLNFTSK